MMNISFEAVNTMTAISTTLVWGSAIAAWGLLSTSNDQSKKGDRGTGTGTAKKNQNKNETKKSRQKNETNDNEESSTLAVLPCIRNRRSVFPKDYLKNPSQEVDPTVIRSLLDAALWGPFHGKCYAGQQHPARFVVLGKKAMVEMQEMTLEYYDRNWMKSRWSKKDFNEEDYQAWRKMTEDEITGRWGPVSYMIAIVMRRQAGPKRFPEWEEAAAVGAAVQNMHIQTSKFPHLACYWSSWHNDARDSDEMKEFLSMEDEDKCFGFFIVAQQSERFSKTRDRRRRDRSLMDVEWRTE